MELHLELALVKLKSAINDFQQATTAVVAEIDNVIKELPQNRVEQWQETRTEPTDNHNNDDDLKPLGYSVIRWAREDTGVYVSRSANGVKLKVYSEGRGQWFAQVGNARLNDKPLPQKSEAVQLIEGTIITGAKV